MSNTETKISRTRALSNLREVRIEIRRLNEAAGETVFNPAATQALEEVVKWARVTMGKES